MNFFENMKILAELFMTFFKIGLFTFGGGYAMLPILQREVVEKKGWATDEELTDYFAVGQCTPGIIAVNNQMMTFHIGDSRIYKLSYRIKQLTEDHTFVNREIKNGNMTSEQAKSDPRRNALTQCIGVSGDITPEIKFGTIESGTNYLICSDGFRHVVTEEEIFGGLSPKLVTTGSSMKAKLRELIETVKSRKEQDNDMRQD